MTIPYTHALLLSGTDIMRHRTAFVILCILTTIGAASCGPGDAAPNASSPPTSTSGTLPEGDAPLSCARTPCPEPMLCVNTPDAGKLCMATCDAPNTRCADDTLCVDTAQGTPICYRGTTPIGATCSSPAECTPGARCIMGEDGPVCAEVCDQPGSLCAGGEVCLQTTAETVCSPGGSSPAGASCTSPADCARGTRCVMGGGAPICVDACEGNDACAPGARCAPLDGADGGVCRPAIGAACATSTDCTDASACTAEFTPLATWVNLMPDGYCTDTGCTTDADCPVDTLCRTPVKDAPSICVAPCLSDADCRVDQGWACLDAQACGSASCRAFFQEASLCMRPDRLQYL